MGISASRAPRALLAVDRAVSEVRRGRQVVMLSADGRAVLVQAAEGATPESLERARSLAEAEPRMAVTPTRARVLGLTLTRNEGETGVALLTTRTPLSAEAAAALADPLGQGAAHAMPATTDLSTDLTATMARAHSAEAAAVRLVKIARLLPAAIVVPLETSEADDPARFAARADLLLVDAGDVFQYEQTAARALKPVSEARVPLEGAENTRVVAFRPDDGGLEHLAIIIGEPDPGSPVLLRLHSECFTGDLLGSLRCDCGDQLKGALGEIAANGSGVLLYLAQEGRGIGLVNKLRAYVLQDDGFDTMDANEQLGFDADERIYLPAARMLQSLGIERVRLLTNNPFKVEALKAFGVDVSERVEHTFPANPHNELYLQTKKAKGGHLF